MSWSYRKSIGVGPFRVNFSKSGVSYSVGVKGARVHVNTHGTYVHLSTHGISYRRKIAGPATPLPPVIPQRITVETIHEITSADVDQLTDIDSQAFITTLNQKGKLVSYVKLWGILPLCAILLLLLFTSVERQQQIIQPASDSTIVRVYAATGGNIRQAPDVKSPVVQKATYGQTFLVLDAANPQWYKIKLADTIAYINHEVADIDYIFHDQVSETQWHPVNEYLVYELWLCFFCFVPLIYWLKKLDRKRFEMELHYDMDHKYQQVYQQFKTHFTTFSRSARIWQYLNAQRTTDQKRNAGAAKLIERIKVRGITEDKKPMPYFITNVAIPCISLNKVELFFLPERLLIKRGSTFAAVFYKNLHITSKVIRFIESDILPNDAKVIDYTWQYVNKSGRPDRRFNNNRQLPVCAYSEYTFTSNTGIFEIISTSKPAAMDDFGGFLTKIGALQHRIGETCK
ncbi:DUF4236 domain-containing protein [Chitinophaga nivalis]|uniref:DUF4236 domain-containing protein n=1 Tax=Chitinophaga nivalis TaxID=2991709 RepID=A0ABT3IS94_9BACT|nr:DUF4236 domain-containing protein [Chitinophaga nivalis]MCW3463462.1 DUF4236 domain-containing protein [Chitinophaga nivalis]MCW3486848.1 DUF4236 domain-containing protein [Chitinophaga nivalis]